MVPAPALVAPIAPAPEVVSYVSQNAVSPVMVNGEVMIGATLPAEVPVYPIPASPYVYSYVNVQRVVVEPTARRIVYLVTYPRCRRYSLLPLLAKAVRV